MRKTLSPFFLLIFMGAYHALWACSCVPPQHFCASAQSEDHVFSAVIVDTDPSTYRMRVAVIENLQNNVGADTITIRGGNGADCGEDVEKFSPGDSIVFGISAPNNEFRLYICGVHFLRIENGVVKGMINKDLESQAYEDFKAGLEECLAIVPATDRPGHGFPLRLSPNPVGQTALVDIGPEQMERLEIFSCKGQLLQTYQPREATTRMELSLAHLQPGIYLIRVWQADHFQVKRIIKL